MTIEGRIVVMKKFLIFISLLFISLDVLASSGSIKQSSVLKCDGVYYGKHSSHWHIVKKEDGKYVIKDSKELEAPSCYLEKENEKEVVTLSKCVDGDTAKFVTKSGEVKTARFLAIDTPESVHPTKEVEKYGKEASEYTCNLLTKAKKIHVEYDKASDKEDKYGRILVWVYVDNKMVQETLLQEGLAKVAHLYEDYEYTNKLKDIESIAKDKKIGIWSSDNVSVNMDSEEEVEENNDEKDFFSQIVDMLLEFLTNLFKEFLNSVFEK